MAKDRPAKKISMKEHIASKANTKNASKSSKDEFVLHSSFDTDFNDKLKEYNTRVTNLDKDYTALKPRFDVLVRVFVKPMETKDGVLIPNTIPVMAPTNSKQGYIGAIEPKHPYSQKAIVISVPEEVTDLKVGDTVYLASSPVKAQAFGKGDNAHLMIPNQFIHPDAAGDYPIDEPVPVNPEDKNYGYLLVKPFDIKIKL